MFRLLLVLFLHQPCRSAELAACSEDSQCPNDFYCESHAFTCRQCLQCELFHRSLPLSSTLCVKSIVECGPCLKGFNNDQESQDSLKDKCTISGVKQKQLIPIYVWIIITVCVSAIIYLVVHLLCKTRVLTKIIYSITCTAAQHTQEQPQGQTRNHVVPSAPYYSAGTPEDPYPRSHQLQMMSVTDTDHPPFYNLLYPPLESNPLLLDQDTSPKEPYKFKPIIPICPKDAYESMNHHSAVVFNRAIYDTNAPANTVPILDNGVTEDTQTSQPDGIIQTVIS
ncbi:uncharacterized protein LOC131853360 [Achroia grisella]|uniref:uncharacterized protein LOC131853360 n=1 Tax=Achroia grisella TaxID=688607 RepID=UPI0027D2257A|nr:uncharacterized protein LOC131853360 [Achroia grisella]